MVPRPEGSVRNRTFPITGTVVSVPVILETTQLVGGPVRVGVELRIEGLTVIIAVV